jgi:hypothetical protein
VNVSEDAFDQLAPPVLPCAAAFVIEVIDNININNINIFFIVFSFQ